MVLLVFKTPILLYYWAIINSNSSPYKQQTGEESCESLNKFLRWFPLR